MSNKDLSGENKLAQNIQMHGNIMHFAYNISAIKTFLLNHIEFGGALIHSIVLTE